MSLKYTLLFALMGSGLLCAAAFYRGELGPLGVMIAVYLAVPYLLLAIAYGGAGSRVFSKAPDGRISPSGWILFAPYHLIKSAVLLLYQVIGRKAPYVEIVPGLHLGRRLSQREACAAQPKGWAGVLDLAGEFPAVQEFRQAGSYFSLPVLDGTSPTLEQLHEAVDWLQRAVPRGPVYVHCALGHGRSAAVVVAYLLAERRVETPQEGESLLRSLRPGVRLNRQQRDVLQRFKTNLDQ